MIKCTVAELKGRAGGKQTDVAARISLCDHVRLIYVQEGDDIDLKGYHVSRVI